MLLFILGIVCGIALSIAYLWLLDRLDSGSPPLFNPQARIRDIERQTLQQMLAAELVARRTSPTPSPGSDVIDSTATDIEPTP